MRTMSEENKENPSEKSRQPISELLMKPFSLGWTREVVRRVVTHSGTPNCDIYYFSPNKKKLRSLTEVKSNLTDGLSLECFSFKREPLGLSPDLETVRDAKVRGKGAEKSKEKRKAPDRLNKANNNETGEDDASDVGKKPKKKKLESDEGDSKGNVKMVETDTNNSENLNTNTNKKEEEGGEGEVEKQEEVEGKEEEGEGEEVREKNKKDPETKPRRAKSDSKDSKESKNLISKDTTKQKAKPAKSARPVRLQSIRKRKSTLKRVMSMKQAKQAKVVPGRKKLTKDINRKKVATSKLKLGKSQLEKKDGLKNKKNSPQKVKPGRKPAKNNNSLAKTKNEVSKAPETNDTDKKSAARDLKSIVKKNIGKYREMREKQKLGVVKNQVRGANKKIAISNLPRSRSEPISKNKPFYLKPLEKGWRRELVYRTNCAKAGQQADVYYFHPNGKKLRSCREIAENLTHGLSIECFTFRKEPLGCGEPSEVIRNARSFQKN